MRVAVVTESFLPTVNGVTTSVCRVLEHLQRAGHDALVICPDAGSPSSYAGFPVHAVPAVAYRQFPVGLPSLQLQKILDRFAPDVVHVASPFLLGAQGIAAANRLGVASVAVFQTDVPAYAARNHLRLATSLAWSVVRRAHERATVTLVPSSASLQALTAAGIPRLQVWGRGVDLERYHPNNRFRSATQRLRERLSPDGEVVVGYVGRIAPEKQVERLRAVRALPGIHLAIVGDGPSVPSVQRALRGSSVTWLGRLGRTSEGVDDLATAYAAFDVFVHAGTDETFGQTLQEANASGLPVIAPASGGPIDLITTGENGILFPANDEHALREAVRALAQDASLRRRMGEAGRRRVLGRSWSALGDALIGHYETAVRSVAAGTMVEPSEARQSA